MQTISGLIAATFTLCVVAGTGNAQANENTRVAPATRLTTIVTDVATLTDGSRADLYVDVLLSQSGNLDVLALEPVPQGLLLENFTPKNTRPQWVNCEPDANNPGAWICVETGGGQPGTTLSVPLLVGLDSDILSGPDASMLSIQVQEAFSQRIVTEQLMNAEGAISIKRAVTE